jgi:hypothetical protein
MIMGLNYTQAIFSENNKPEIIDLNPEKKELPHVCRLARQSWFRLNFYPISQGSI